VTAPGGFCASSDERLKKNIMTIADPTQIVESLRGVTYDWKDEIRHEINGSQMGVIAQEVESVIPSIVNTDGTGYKSVDYAKLTAVLIESVKHLSTEIKSLKKQLSN